MSEKQNPAMCEDTGDEVRMVKYFCPRYGKEMWELADPEQTWDDMRLYSLASLKILLVCSDCLLEEIWADREASGND